MRCRPGPWGLLLALMALGCQESDPVAPRQTVEQGGRVYRVFGDADGSDRFVVGIGAEGLGEAWGLQGRLMWPAGRVRATGQIPVDGVAVVLGEAAGRETAAVEFMMLAPFGASGAVAHFGFQCIGSCTPEEVRFVVSGVAGSEGPARVVRTPDRRVKRTPSPTLARSMEWFEWRSVLAADEVAVPMRVPGEGDLYGDITLNGTIDVLDALAVARIGVGNPAEECMLGSDAPTDDCLAGNVFPFNEPGLGEVGDPCPPGWEDCSGPLPRGRRVDVNDALPIAREGVGNFQPVVGETIPKVPQPATAIDVPAVITGTVTLTNSVLHRLNGEVRVGIEGGAAGELVIEPGTRIEALPGSALTVTRAGRIIADARSLLPITFECATGQPGCWRGITVYGNALVSTTDTDPSPVIAGRSAGGCGQVLAGQLGGYGGCADTDSSGVIRHVHVYDAGLLGFAALDLRGVGSRTVVEEVQTVEPAEAGFAARGGAVDLKRIRAIASLGPGLIWSHGWRGRLQFGLIQAGNNGSPAVLGRNVPGAPDALPRSAPHVRNLTVVGPSDPAAAFDLGGGVRLTDGTAGTIRTSVFFGQPEVRSAVLDVDVQETWDRLVSSEDLALDSSLIVGYGRLGDQDVDPFGLGSLVTPDAEGYYLRDSARGNRLVTDFAQVDSTFRGPFASVPDLRPFPLGTVAQNPCPSVPADDFFETAPHCGAIPALGYGDVPWFEPGPVVSTLATPITPALGYLEVLVISDTRGPLAGVELDFQTGVGVLGITGRDGIFRTYIEGDGSVIQLDRLPMGCPDTLGIIVLEEPGPLETSFVEIETGCTPL